MGGRGARFGVSKNGKPYGTEFYTVLQKGKIKFVKSVTGNAKAPMETMTKGRIYVTVNEKDELKYITFFDRQNKRRRQIDLMGNFHIIDGEKVLPHVHKGYIHNENGDRKLTKKEQTIVERVKRTWYNRNNK